MRYRTFFLKILFYRSLSFFLYDFNNFIFFYLRFYDVDSGSIRIGGEDLKNIDQTWLRKRIIGLINQEPVLFAMSILENIRYGKPEATDIEVRK